MLRRALSVGELAVHFGLEPVDVEWLVYECATGTPWGELVEEIRRFECTLEEAQRLAREVGQLASHATVLNG